MLITASAQVTSNSPISTAPNEYACNYMHVSISQSSPHLLTYL